MVSRMRTVCHCWLNKWFSLKFLDGYLYQQELSKNNNNEEVINLYANNINTESRQETYSENHAGSFQFPISFWTSITFSFSPWDVLILLKTVERCKPKNQYKLMVSLFFIKLNVLLYSIFLSLFILIFLSFFFAFFSNFHSSLIYNCFFLLPHCLSNISLYLFSAVFIQFSFV